MQQRGFTDPTLFLFFSSCAGSISKALSALPEITSSAISPLQGSAIIEHSPSLLMADIKETIEDAGFDANWISTTSLEKEVKSKGRVVRIKIDGMFCNSCVAKVHFYLTSLQTKGQILSWTTITLKNPISTITYVPSSDFTIRHLLSDLSALDPAFTTTPYSPPSISTRARAIQAKEAKVLLVHFAIAFAAAIPTFVIAIVGMTLLPKKHGFRMYWEESVWGGAGRGTVALWVLATVVQFGVGRCALSLSLFRLPRSSFVLLLV